MKVSIITIGDEILNGTTINTNSAFLGEICTLHGLEIIAGHAVPDTKTGITNGIKTAWQNADIILVTGGLGPTKDDITKETLASFFNCEMVFNPSVFKTIEDYFAKRGKKQVELNRKLAYIPEKCELITNEKGTAFGMWFKEKNKVLVSMPGVPHEMKFMFENHILPKIKSSFSLPTIINKYIMCSGIGESRIYEKIEDIENSLPPHIKLAYLPSLGYVKLRLTYKNETKDTEKEQELIYFQNEIVNRIKKYVFSLNENDNLANVVGKLLLEKKATVSTAESCTGGYIAHLLTSNAGSSAYYEGSVIAYSYDVKKTELGVQQQTLEKYGAVSEETVREMLEGLLKKTNTTYGIAVSGIAGPGGGLPGKPVGTVWIAVGDKNNMTIKKFELTKERTYNIKISSHTALNMLRNFILESN
ncbi:MAG: competence/damage-inducible protein A [Chitinophagales bacterium]|nr:competence/damage-inducible protein A [Chitinophagales bacterium]